MKYLAIAFTSLLLLASCNQKPKKIYESVASFESSTHQISNGKQLLENKCYVCHNPSSDHDARIAPPMVAIKSYYLDDNTTKGQFANAIWNFVKKPSEENSKMKGAVRRFGVMPYQPFKEEEIRQIADYMYENKIDEPEWFKKHIEEESNGKMKYRNDGKKMGATNAEENKSPAEKGLEYALNTTKELGKNLMGAIQKKGTVEAVEFCNVRAYPITDSMATAQNATIKRVSDKPRNPKNRASTKELKIIERYKAAVANGEDYEPVTEMEKGRNTFYYPIIINAMCLQCHGIPDETVQPEVLTVIKDLYPNDKATGYNINEVRGMWAIEFDKTE